MRFALLKVTLLVLAGSTWVFWSFVFSTRPETAAEDALESLVRLPASLPQQIPGMSTLPSTRANDPIEMDVVRIPCWEKSSSPQIDTSARWIRLTGRRCQGEAAAPLADSVSVRNLTNGYVATVFPMQNRNMTTDFIPLQSGHNEILIHFDQGEGASVESQVSFVRE